MKILSRREEICLDDWRAIHSLLNTNLPLQECLALIENKKNAHIFKKIITDLKMGKDYETVLKPYICKELQNTFSSFIKILPLNKALNLALNSFDYENDRNKEIRKNIFYPALLFFFSLTGLYLFEAYGLDSIFTILKSFEIDTRAFELIRAILRIFTNAIYLITIVLMSIFLIFKSRQRIVYFYILLVRYMPNSLLETYYSQEFISFYRLTYRMGYKTKESIEILRSLKDKPIVSFIAYHVKEAFLEGKNMDEAMHTKYLDNRVSAFMKIAILSNDFDNMINNYVEFTKLELFRKIKFYTKVVQTFVYLLVGLLIIFIYQILFLPMQAIGQL